MKIAACLATSRCDKFSLRHLDEVGGHVDTVYLAGYGDATPAALQAGLGGSRWAGRLRPVARFPNHLLAVRGCAASAAADGVDVLLVFDSDVRFDQRDLSGIVAQIRGSPAAPCYRSFSCSFWKCLDNLIFQGSANVHVGKSLFAIDPRRPDLLDGAGEVGGRVEFPGIGFRYCYASVDDNTWGRILGMAWSQLEGLRGGPLPPFIKDFREDFFKLYKMFTQWRNFTFTRFNDGELAILKGNFIDLRGKAHGEFKFDPADTRDQELRMRLLKSFQRRAPDHFVGICNPMGFGMENWRMMVELSGQDMDQLTWANLFVNANYPLYLEYFVKEFANRRVVVVCNKDADLGKAPFAVVKEFRVGVNAWMDDAGVVSVMSEWIRSSGVRDHVFLLAAGPFGDILAGELSEVSKENTYLNVGSTLDPLIGLGATRGYLRGEDSIKEVCRWVDERSG